MRMTTKYRKTMRRPIGPMDLSSSGPAIYKYSWTEAARLLCVEERILLRNNEPLLYLSHCKSAAVIMSK